MSPTFRTTRNVELSLLYALDTWISADWTGITILKTFADVYAKDVNLPIVCARLDDTATSLVEVGSTTLDNRYLIIIDIFAKSNGQRLDLADYIKDKLKDGWIHYDHAHSSGDPTVLTRTVNGRDNVTDWVTDSKINIGETTDTKDKYRHNISVRVKHTNG